MEKLSSSRKSTLGLRKAESLAVLGRNGTGKTTLLNTIIGVTRHRNGTIELGGRNLTRMRPDKRAIAGIGWVPQERNIFKSLTVEENSLLSLVRARGRYNGYTRCFLDLKNDAPISAIDSRVVSSRC